MHRDRGLVVIAVFKFVKVVLLLVIGCGALELVRTSVASGAQDSAALLTSGVDRRLTQLVLARIGGLSPARLEAVGVGAFFYAALYAVEGVGLWRGRTWAEYVTTVATASFVPVELYELFRRFTAVRLSALAVNLAVVAYLLRYLRTSRRTTAE